MGQIKIEKGNILIDGQKTQIISGTLHYFRIHPDLWDDRLDKAVAFGVNAIESYVAWNIHEPHRGEFCFEGICDLEKFISKVHARGLKMILRPGPYICAEWDNGGFPGWLTGTPGMELRRMYQPYIDALTAWYDVLLPRIRKHLYTTGEGPIIMLQVENEYGSYCHDKDYLRYIYNLYGKYNIDVPRFTSDGAGNHFILGGTIPEATMTLNFGSNSEDSWKKGREFRPEGPDFCMEFWNGWFDHWGEKHHVRPAGTEVGGAAYELDKMLSDGASVNFYMLHGGTNFGFTNGANGNFGDDYAATVTSYDYDCPLSECGDPTVKFTTCQKVIAKHFPQHKISAIKPTKKVMPPNVRLDGSACLFANIAALATKSGQAMTPPTMDALGENFGFIHYRKRLDGPMTPIELHLFNVNDYAQVWLDGKYIGSRMRDTGKNPLQLPAFGAEGAVLDILVENCGRINYGPFVGKDAKGIVGAVCLSLQMQLYWDYNLLPLSDISGLKFTAFSAAPGAAFHRGEFELSETGDAFLRRPGKKGLVWINGFNLGRYNAAGPTETLYVPSPVLRRGRNEVVVFEQEELAGTKLSFSPVPLLGPTE